MLPDTRSGTDPVPAIHSITEFPAAGEERPPMVTGACVTAGLLDSGVLHQLRADLAAGTDLGRSRGPVTDLRERLDTLLNRAFGPIELHTVVGTRYIGRGSHAGWCTVAAEPLPCVSVRHPDAGWWTTVRTIVPLVVPDGTRWSLHLPRHDVTVSAVGEVAFLGPRVAHTISHPALRDAAHWLVTETTMRFRYRWAAPLTPQRAG